MEEKLDKQHRYPWEVIELAVFWYQHNQLTYRAVSERLLQHGVSVSHKTVFEWVQKFGNVIAGRQRKAHQKNTKIQEKYVKVNGEWKYMYQSTDSKGNTLNAVLRDRRNLASARSFLKRTEDEH
jgi:putative transposase